MKTTIAVIGLGIAALAAPSVKADNYGDRADSDPSYGHPYVGLSAGPLLYKEDGLSTITPTVFLFHIGQSFNRFVAIEARVGTGLDSGEWDGYRARVDAEYAGYVKGSLPMTPWFSGYALAGVNALQMHRNYPDFNSTETGFSYGLGAEAALVRGTSLTLEWVRLTTGTNDYVYHYSADQVALGVIWRW
jgi:hypothetical protein